MNVTWWCSFGDEEKDDQTIVSNMNPRSLFTKTVNLLTVQVMHIVHYSNTNSMKYYYYTVKQLHHDNFDKQGIKNELLLA